MYFLDYVFLILLFCLNITDGGGGTAVALSLESHRLSEDMVPYTLLCLLKGRTLFPHPIKMPSLLLYLPPSVAEIKRHFCDDRF